MLLDLTLLVSIDNPIFGKVSLDLAAPTSAGHVGTHLDKMTGEPIPLEWIDRNGVLVDVRPETNEIGLNAIHGVEIREGDFVFFATDHIARHEYGSRSYFEHHPQLEWPLIEDLVRRGVSLIGIDAPAIRRGKDEHIKADNFCAQHQSYVIENLVNLGRLPNDRNSTFPVHLGWIGRPGMTGWPVQVVARIPG